MKKLIICLVLSFLIVLPSIGAATVWKVETDSSVLYIGGTIHLLRASDFPLPEVFNDCYEKSEMIIFETDFAQLLLPETQQAIMSAGMYSDGTTIDKVLSAETYDILEKYCTANGIPLASLHQFRPSLLMVSLLQMELQKMGVTQEGVDMHFYNKSLADKKKLGGLETVEDQIAMLTTMGEGYEDDFIKYSIADFKNTAEQIEKIISSWKTGDVGKVFQILFKEMKDQFPELYKIILVDRNMKWLPKIENHIVTPQTELILVGAAHLVGEDGVIAHLKKLGYRITKLEMKVAEGVETE